MYNINNSFLDKDNTQRNQKDKYGFNYVGK